MQVRLNSKTPIALKKKNPSVRENGKADVYGHVSDWHHRTFTPERTKLSSLAGVGRGGDAVLCFSRPPLSPAYRREEERRTVFLPSTSLSLPLVGKRGGRRTVSGVNLSLRLAAVSDTTLWYTSRTRRVLTGQ